MKWNRDWDKDHIYRLDYDHPDYSLLEVRRFMSKVYIPSHDEYDLCWLWLGSVNNNGYGQFRTNNRCVLAHRFIYEYVHEVSIGNYCLLHSCDTRLCVNPTHLSPGTYADNIHDMMRKGRMAKNLGEACGNHKLTDEKVIEIRRLRTEGMSTPKIGAMFGISAQNVDSITKGETWTHLL